MIGIAIMKVVKKDVMFLAGPLQACSGIPSGGDAAVHAVRESFENPEMEGVLLVDASNAFNSLNRKVALLNMRYVCPALETVLTNCGGVVSLSLAHSSATIRMQPKPAL